MDSIFHILDETSYKDGNVVTKFSIKLKPEERERLRLGESESESQNRNLSSFATIKKYGHYESSSIS